MSVIAFISDVHDRVEPLEKALEHLAGQGAERYIQLGDLGPAPLPLLDSLPASHLFGNWEVSGLHEFPVQRQDTVASWPAKLMGSNWVASHATPAFPEECSDLAATRRYMNRQRVRWLQLFPSLLYDDQAIWQAFAFLEDHDLLVAFHGHTHVQCAQQLTPDNRLIRVQGQRVRLTPGTRTLVGVGSIGVPRDGNRSRCVLFNSTLLELDLIEIPS